MESVRLSATSRPTVKCELQCAEYLGAGTSGSVYGLGPAPDGRRYAVKTVKLETDVPSAGQLAECKLHASLPQHDALLQYFFSWTATQTLHILLERVDSELWDSVDGPKGSVDVSERTEWAEALLSAVSCLHAHGIAHRDISPWNCFLANHVEPASHRPGSGGNEPTSSHQALKVGDFGLACRVQPTGSATNLGGLFGMETDGFAPLDDSAVGSLYSAPELGSEGGYEGKEVDIFSAGMTLFAIWHAVVQQEPSGDGQQHDLTTDVETLKTTGELPAGWAAAAGPVGDLIRQMVSHDPQQRPAAADAVALFRAAAASGQRMGAPTASKELPAATTDTTTSTARRGGLIGVASGWVGRICTGRRMSGRISPAPAREVVL